MVVVAFRIIHIVSPSPSPFPLDFGLWIWDLGLGLGLDNNFRCPFYLLQYRCAVCRVKLLVLKIIIRSSLDFKKSASITKLSNEIQSGQINSCKKQRGKNDVLWKVVLEVCCKGI